MEYDGSPFPPFAVTADLVVLTIRDDDLQVLLIQRGSEPYAHRWALPGGFAQPDEDITESAYRELAEEAGVTRADVHLEQLRAYGAPGRDPRMRVVSVAWLALGPDLPEPVADSDASHAAWVPVSRALRSRPGLAFDHGVILRDALERAGAKLEYTNLAVQFVGPTFTVADLRRVYEIVWGVTVDPRNFHRKVTGVPGLLVDTGTTRTDGGRPARLYRAGKTTELVPPITR